MISVPTEKGKTMNKIGWTIEQISELTENLYKHHADYGQGKTQDFHSVCLNCKYAAEVISQLLDNVKANNAKIRGDLDREKQIAELEYRANKTESDNNMLKECIVRMALGRYGVLND